MILLDVFIVYCRVFPHCDAVSEDTLSDTLVEGSRDGGVGLVLFLVCGGSRGVFVPSWPAVWRCWSRRFIELC